MTHPTPRLFLATCVAALIAPAMASAAVYPGCASPPALPSGNVHYVDPVNGSNKGDGTAAHPWHTLTEVVAAGLFYNTPVHGQPHINTSAPIQAGDTVYLMSGNHGPVTIQGYNGVTPTLVGFNNSSFITIAAAPGQTPVLSQLSILGGSKWVFRGLTIQSLNNTGSFTGGGTSGADFWLVRLLGPHSDIVLDGNNLSSTTGAVANSWSISDWLTKRASGIKDYQGNCIAVTNNNLQYIGFGISTQSSTNVNVSSNKIDTFADDGIDYGSSNLQMVGNTITNSVEDGDGYHRDGMQGQPVLSTMTINNVVIRSNTVIRIANPSLLHPGYLQGIDAFDGLWTNVTVANNTVVTDATQGISLYGVTGASVTSNILVGDSGKVLPCGGLTFSQCQAKSVIYDTSTVPQMVIMPSKTAAPSRNVTLTNNYVTGFGVDVGTVNPTISNNLCILTAGKCTMTFPINGVKTSHGAPGVYGNNNVISIYSASQLFTTFDTVGMHYNFTVLPGRAMVW
jgi:hypothetical protein